MFGFSVMPGNHLEEVAGRVYPALKPPARVGVLSPAVLDASRPLGRLITLSMTMAVFHGPETIDVVAGWALDNSASAGACPDRSDRSARPECAHQQNRPYRKQCPNACA